MVKTMYKTTVTHEIVKAWAKGASAEETKKYLEAELGLHICLNTIYKKRRSLEAQEMIDELVRNQLRDITTTKNEQLKMQYRNELLKILLPLRIETVNKNLSINQTTTKHVIELVDPDNPAEQYC
jgi:polyphosphate kinase